MNGARKMNHIKSVPKICQLRTLKWLMELIKAEKSKRPAL